MTKKPDATCGGEKGAGSVGRHAGRLFIKSWERADTGWTYGVGEDHGGSCWKGIKRLNVEAEV